MGTGAGPEHTVREKILKAFQDSIKIKDRFVQENLEAIAEASRLIADTFNKGGKLFLFGNGGSSTDASHITAEFVGRFKKERPGLPAISLNTDMAIITCVANDYDYSEGQKAAASATLGFVGPSRDTPRIQETHITLGHVLCQMVEEILFEAPRKK